MVSCHPPEGPLQDPPTDGGELHRIVSGTLQVCDERNGPSAEKDLRLPLVPVTDPSQEIESGHIGDRGIEVTVTKAQLPGSGTVARNPNIPIETLPLYLDGNVLPDYNDKAIADSAASRTDVGSSRNVC